MDTFFVMKRLCLLRTPINSEGLYIERFKERISKINVIHDSIKGIVVATQRYFYCNDIVKDFNTYIEGADYDEKQIKISLLCTDRCYSSPQKITIYFLTDNSALQSPFLHKAAFNSLSELAYEEGIDINAMRIIWKDKDFDIPIDKAIKINGSDYILHLASTGESFQRLVDINEFVNMNDFIDKVIKYTT